MKVKHVIVLGAILFLPATTTDALSLDLSALSSSATRQIVANGKHLQKYERAEFEVSAQYVKTQDKEDAYDFGIENLYHLDYGLRTESDYRFFQDRSTFSGAVGVGIKFITLSGGFRQDTPNDAPMQTYGKLAVTARFTVFPIAVSARSEALLGENGQSRLDYRVEGKMQFNRFYVAVKVERQKGLELQALGLGFSF